MRKVIVISESNQNALFTMIYLKCLAILGIIIASAFCNNTVPPAIVELKPGHVKNTTENIATPMVTTTNIPIDIQSTTSTNISSNVKTRPEGKRRTVLIINGPSLLRQVKGKKKSKGKRGKGADPTAAVETLLYLEYNEDGTVLVEVLMNNMEDVSKFFEVFLHTELCRGKCES